MATVRPMTRSVASHTSPMPPIAIRESQLVAAAEGDALRRSHLSQHRLHDLLRDGRGDRVAAARLALPAAVFDDDRDGHLRVVRGGETGEPQGVRLVRSVLRGAGLTGHVDPVYSCTRRRAVIDIGDHHRDQSRRRCPRSSARPNSVSSNVCCTERSGADHSIDHAWVHDHSSVRDARGHHRHLQGRGRDLSLPEAGERGLRVVERRAGSWTASSRAACSNDVLKPYFSASSRIAVSPSSHGELGERDVAAQAQRVGDRHRRRPAAGAAARVEDDAAGLRQLVRRRVRAASIRACSRPTRAPPTRRRA